MVGTPDELVGVLRPERVAEALRAVLGSVTVESMTDASFHHAHPDHPVDVVLERLADSDGLLPVISRDDTRRLEGVVTVDDVARVLGRGRRS